MEKTKDKVSCAYKEIYEILKIFPKEYLKDINHLFVWHGRKTCDSRKPLCDTCTVKQFCKYYLKSSK